MEPRDLFAFLVISSNFFSGIMEPYPRKIFFNYRFGAYIFPEISLESPPDGDLLTLKWARWIYLNDRFGFSLFF